MSVNYTDQIENHENRLLKLENDENVNNIFSVLKKIEEKLLGGLETDSPGLVFEVKRTQENLIEITKRVKNIETIATQVKEEGSIPTKSKLYEIEAIKTEIRDVRKDIKNLNIHRWIVYGSIITLIYFMSHPTIIKSLFGVP